jgi:hypothetical protein
VSILSHGVKELEIKKIISTILALTLLSISCQAQTIAAGPLPSPIVTQNSVEICLNSRYSQHSLSKTAASAQQLSNILWAAGKAPFTGSYRNIYAVTPSGTYLYDPNNYSLSSYSNEVANDGSFQIRYESELDFDSGVSFMPALLASVSLCRSTESQVASCPKGIGYPKARLIFGVQAVKELTSALLVHSSVSQGQPGWLPDPCTAGGNSLEEVLTNLNYISSFTQTNLTPQQISQILWAGYGCSAHTTTNSRAGLTVPSAMANYYLSRSIYLVNESGVYRYHNRNPVTSLATRDHKLEQLSSAGTRGGEPLGGELPADVRGALRSAVSGLPEAPCYIILCLNSASYTGQDLHYAQLETGFVAGNMLIQATAIDLGCHFKTKLTSGEQSNIRAATNISTSHIPQAIVSIGPAGVPVSISVVLQGRNRPDAGWVVPLTISFFPPEADVFNDAAVYEFKLTTTKSAAGSTAICEIPGIAPGIYDVTVQGESTLMNVKRGVVISLPKTSVDLGTLLEGDANQDNMIDFADFAILAMNWLASNTNGGKDNRADFDRNGLINAADLYLLTTNWPLGGWLKTSPVEIQ